MSASKSYYLTLTAHQDRPGISAAVSNFLAERKLNILESAQYGDASTSRFFMRNHFEATSQSSLSEMQEIKEAFMPVAEGLGSSFELHDAEEKPRVLLMVSKIGHCLNDLLFRASTGQLPVTISLIISNHPDFKHLAEVYKVPFHHIPVNKEIKPKAEQEVLDLIKLHQVELVVLARYMQVMSANFCEKAPPTINVHHGLLPAFQGAKPYHQAFDRGTKIIGATSHFASKDLDEGPIIEQDVEKVHHAMDPKALVNLGSAIESTVLARAVKWWAERRVLLNGSKTVVFN